MELIPASEFSLEQLVKVYNDTRADYLLPMPMTVEHLREYVRVYDVDLSASVVAVEGKRLIGVCMVGLRGSVTRLGVADGEAAGCPPAGTLPGTAQAWARRARSRVIADNEAGQRLFEGGLPHGGLLVLRRPAVRLPGPARWHV